MYFESMPVIYYNLLEGAPEQIVKDVTVRTKVAAFIKNSAFLYENYIVKDGERPEHVAARVYGKPTLHWIILLANEIIDPYTDWPMSDSDLFSYVSTFVNPIDIHHYEDRDGNWVNNTESQLNVYPISNLEYYSIQNDKRRLIKIVKPGLAEFFIEEYNRLVKQ